MQIKRFENGSFVVHKIKGSWSGWCSAWFKADGTITDAQQIILAGHVARRVKPDGPMWQELAVVGRIARPKQEG